MMDDLYIAALKKWGGDAQTVNVQTDDKRI